MHITYFFRKSRTGAFSIEQLFKHVQQEFPKGVSYVNHYMNRHSTGLWNRIKLILEAYRHRGQINHVTGDINFITFLLPKANTILTVHDIESLERKDKLVNAFLKVLWLQIPVSKAKFISVVSEATKQKLLNSLSVDPDKIVVIPNVISPLFQYKPKAFNKTEPVILQVGTKYNKNLERTIAALDGVPCRFVIIGKLEKEQLQLLKQYQISYMNYVGISDSELRELYVQADIVTFVSLFEGFGMPIVEAQATGRPIITSNCSSMPEVAGKGALLVDPESVNDIRQGIVRLIQDEDLRRDLVAKGLENCRRYSNKAIAQQYLDLYKRI